MKRMLINATQAEECRLAIVDGQKLLDFETEVEGQEQRKGNIYKAVVTRVEPSLDACFIDYGEDRHGFLPLKEISKEYFAQGVSAGNAKIDEAIKEGQELLVQVVKEERGNKGAAMTTFISLAGRYIVLMPNNPRGGGVSRRIEGSERQQLKDALSQLKYPKGMSIIARTAGIGHTAEQLQWDLNYLLKLWTAVDEAGKTGEGAFLIYQESNLVIRAIRDYFDNEIGDILIDADDVYEQAHQFMNHVMPEHAFRVKRYRDNAPLFSRFQIEHQIESAYSRTVQLPSGGAIVIDHTEALVSIDVNSARAIKGSDIEETAFRTNLEAAEEVARQMRLRDLGGLIVIDFIDMDESRNRREVENSLRKALREDRARVQFGSISKFGLMEMSRQRLKPALNEGASTPCPRCGGSGHIRDTESSALQILRVIQEESMKDSTAAVHVQVPVDVASFLLNEKRPEIAKIEIKQRISVMLVPNKFLETPHYLLERLRHDDPRLDQMASSYKLAEDIEKDTEVTRRKQEPRNRQQPVLKGIIRETPAPAAPADKSSAHRRSQDKTAPAIKTAASAGFIAWVKSLFSAHDAQAPNRTPAQVKKADHSDQAQGAGKKNEQSSSGGQNRSSGRNRGGRRRNQNGNRQNRNDASRQQNRRQQNQTETSDNAAPQDAQSANESRAQENTDRRARRSSRNGHEQNRQNQGDNKKENQDERRHRRDTRRAQDTAESSSKNQARNESHDAQKSDAQTATENQSLKAQAPKDKNQTAQSDRPAAKTQQDAQSEPRSQARAADEKADKTDKPTPSEQEPAVQTRSYFARAQEEDNKVQSSEKAAQVDVSAVKNANDSKDQTASHEPSADSTTEDIRIVQAEALVEHERPEDEPYILPLKKLDELIHAAGLQWVQSEADKIAAAQAAMAAEPQSVHIPRERPVLPEICEEPLILVETQKRLDDVQLPFELEEIA